VKEYRFVPVRFTRKPTVRLMQKGSLLLPALLAAAVLAFPVPTPAEKARPRMTYTNPVYDHDFPDPFVLAADGKFYAYATHGRGFGFQVMESPDLVHWTHKGTAFEVPWSKEHYWAPEVIEVRGTYYMTYSARNPETRRHDIGIATAASPLGPFTDRAILVRAGDVRVGVIDTTVFEDRDGWHYLIYSEEEPRRIVMRRMAKDLLSVEDEVTELLKPDRPEEHGVTEAPTMVFKGGKYHLIYSTGWFQSNKRDANYSVYRAVSRNLRGPYVKDKEPLLATVPGSVYGPGHQSVVRLRSGEWWMAYHAWDAQNEPRYGSNPIGRSLRIDRLYWKGDRPSMTGPTVTPQPSPKLR
jgi:beta-xylosidase